MANATPSRLGQINASGDALALFLKVFGGEVMAEFLRQNIFMNRFKVRSISSGKSAQFPHIGKNAAEYHTVGNEIVGAVSNHGERVINVDGLLISHSFIGNIDEAMNHYDVRGEYSTQMGEAIARKCDQQLAQTAVLAARASATVTGGNGGSVITNASLATDADALLAAMFLCAQYFDEKDVPAAGRFMALRPAQYYLVTQSTKPLNRDWGGSGSYSLGTTGPVADIELVKSNNIPSTNVNTGITTYQGNFSTTVGFCALPGAVGTVKLLEMATEMAYDIRRQGTLMVAKTALGHGILRPDMAIELKTS